MTSPQETPQPDEKPDEKPEQEPAPLQQGEEGLTEPGPPTDPANPTG